MNWGAVGIFFGVIGVLIGIAGFVANRRAARVLSVRIEGESYVDSEGQWSVTSFRVAGANAEHWQAATVHPLTPGVQIAAYVPTGEEDGYGNSYYGPGPWSTYLKLADHTDVLGIATRPVDEDVQLVFTLLAKSDPSIALGSQFVVTPRPVRSHQSRPNPTRKR